MAAAVSAAVSAARLGLAGVAFPACLGMLPDATREDYAHVSPLEWLNAAATEVAALLKTTGGVWRYVRALNRQRTRNVDVGAAYPFLAGSMLSMLDRCGDEHNVDALLQAMMLAQSFYRVRASADGAPGAPPDVARRGRADAARAADDDARRGGRGPSGDDDLDDDDDEHDARRFALARAEAELAPALAASSRTTRRPSAPRRSQPFPRAGAARRALDDRAAEASAAAAPPPPPPPRDCDDGGGRGGGGGGGDGGGGGGGSTTTTTTTLTLATAGARAAIDTGDDDADAGAPRERCGSADDCVVDEHGERRRSNKQFLKSAIQSHPIWRDQTFWREALALCVAKQEEIDSAEALARRRAPPRAPRRARKRRRGWQQRRRAARRRRAGRRRGAGARPPPPPPTRPGAASGAGVGGGGATDGMGAPFPLVDDSSVGPLFLCWELSERLSSAPPPDSAAALAAHEAFVRRRKVLFSQLGGIVHGMLEFGLERRAVQDFVDAVCADHGLSHEEHALITSHIAMKSESEQI